MKLLIYNELKLKGFKSLGKNDINHADIIKAFERKESGHYVEVYKEFWGISVIIYGDGFMRGYYPSRIDLTENKDVEGLSKKLQIIESKNL